MIGVGDSGGKGRGVFARRRIRRGELIERAPVIVIPASEWPHVEKTILCVYSFSWGPDGEEAALALGCGSLYNHSFRPNARYLKRYDQRAIDFVALRDVEEGEEVTVNYNGSPEDQGAIWFHRDYWGRGSPEETGLPDSFSAAGS